MHMFDCVVWPEWDKSAEGDPKKGKTGIVRFSVIKEAIERVSRSLPSVGDTVLLCLSSQTSVCLVDYCVCLHRQVCLVDHDFITDLCLVDRVFTYLCLADHVMLCSQIFVHRVDHDVYLHTPVLLTMLS